MNHIFVSHATADHAIVDTICDELERRAISLWVDHRKGIPVGENWTSAIQEAVHTCEAGLLVLSKASAASDWCDKECTRILGLKKKLYIVLIEPLALEEIPIQYANLQYLDLSTSFDQLPELVEAIVGKKSLDERDPAVKKIKRLTGRIDRSLTAIPLQGRGDDLATCLQGLSEAPVCIVGVGGRGKSRLAAEVALTAEAYDGIVWHYVQSFYTANDLLAALRDHLMLEAAADTAAILRQLRADKTLIVVDNAESVADAARAGYRELLENAFSVGAGVLITTREGWDSFDPVVEVSPGELSSANAEALVLEMARAYGVTIDLSPHAAAIAADARKHPRLIETAVKQAKQLPVAQVLSNLRQFKGRDFETALDKMIHTSFGAMTAKAGDAPLNALRRLSVTRGGFRYEAALALCAPDLPAEDSLQTALATLADWQFCRLGAGERYRLDPLAAEVAERELTTVTLLPNPHQIHLYYYGDLVERTDKATHATKYMAVDLESDNLDAAFEWAIENDLEHAYWLANTATNFFANRARFTKPLDWFTRLEPKIKNKVNDRVWALFQISFGNAYYQYPFGNRRDNIWQTITVCEEALKYCIAENMWSEYAGTQNNLGNAFKELAEIEDRTINLKRSIASHQEALLYRTADDMPMEYAMTQNNLGTAYSDLASVEDTISNLRKAISAYEAALIYRTAAAVPLQFATTTNNLGTAYTKLASLENTEANLQLAITLYRSALVYRTPETAPLDYAQTHFNLGNAYGSLANVKEDLLNLHLAVAEYEIALNYYMAETVPMDYAMTQNNLGATYRKLAEIENKENNQERAIATYNAALARISKENAPLYYAGIKSNLGLIYEDRGELRLTIDCWLEAETYFRQMDMIEDADKMVSWIADVEARLGGA